MGNEPNEDSHLATASAIQLAQERGSGNEAKR
jgi:hypothetical protein